MQHTQKRNLSFDTQMRAVSVTGHSRLLLASSIACIKGIKECVWHAF
jgi:hypothetical protein